MDIRYKKRVEELRSRLKSEETDVYLLINVESSDAANLRYLTGFKSSSGLLLVSEERGIFMTDGRYLEAARRELDGWEIILIENNPLQTGIEQLKSLPGNKVGFDQEKVTVGVFKKLQEGLPEKELQALPSPIQEMREIKDEEELKLQREAAKIADGAMGHAREVAQAGMTEKELAVEIETYMKTNGAEDVSFDPIVASGQNSALPHAEPTDRLLRKNDLVLIDIGARYQGYCSDLTRTFSLGPPSQKAADIYELVLAAQGAGLEAISPGKSGKEVDQAAREVIEGEGFGDHFGHGLGHGVGMEVHEPPKLSQTSDSVLESNMVTTVEPGIYLNGWGGIRIEDMVAVEESGFRTLSSFPKGEMQNLLNFGS